VADHGAEGFAVRARAWGLILVCLAGCVSAEQRQTRELAEEGVRLYKVGRYKEARQTFESALTLSPGEPSLLYDLGQCYERTGNVARAEQLYQECCFRSPDHPECRHALTVLLVKQKREDDAKRMIGDWLARSPKCATAFAEYGWLLHQAGNLPSAQSCFQQALAIDPLDRRALVELAQLFEEEKRPGLALVLYERADRAYPNHPDIKPRLEALLAAHVQRPHPE
jgi:tetratricopeptide (TPR) repeat protein